MKRIIFTLSLLFLYILSFSQKENNDKLQKTFSVTAVGKTREEAKYNGLSKAFEYFGYMASTSTILVDNNQVDIGAIIQSCIIDSYTITEEKKTGYNQFAMTLKVTATNGSLFLVYNFNIKDNFRLLIFEDNEEAKKYMEYLTSEK